MGVIINNPAFIACYIALMLTSTVANAAAARIDELIRERDALKKQQADADGLVERLAVMMAAQGTKKPDEVA